MWCPECQSEVATEMSADGQSLLCTSCSSEVRKVFAPSLHPETKSARELLERWAEEQRVRKGRSPEVVPGPTSVSESVETPENRVPDAAESKAADPSPGSEQGTSLSLEETRPADAVGDSVELPAPEAPTRPKYRVDAAHSGPGSPARPQNEAVKRPRHLEKVSVSAGETDQAPPAEPPPAPPVSQPEPRRRIDTLHAATPEPHFDVRTIGRSTQPGRTESFWGQLLAYAGVGLLTVGSVLVLWGYFGGLEEYASTGWLISTAGQMLLLLGIVTLVAGGMQQTTFEVTERIEHLGGRIIRIEQSTDEILKGPFFDRVRERQGAAEESEAA